MLSVSFAKDKCIIECLAVSQYPYLITWVTDKTTTPMTTESTEWTPSISEQKEISPEQETRVIIQQMNGSVVVSTKYYLCPNRSSGWNSGTGFQLFWGWVEQEGGAKWNSF